MATFNMTIQARGKAGEKRSTIGTATIFVPTLKDFGIDVEPTSTDIETGLPIYESNEMAYLFNAIFSAAKATARNKLKPASIELLDGKTLPTTLAELVEPAEGNNGAHLKLFKEFTSAVVAHAATIGKSAKAQATLASWIATKATLSVISAEHQEKASTYILGAMEAMSEADQEKYARVAQGLLDVIEASNDEGEADDL